MLYPRDSNMKILIVEDEILIQRSLQKLLEKKGATVSATANGKEAIDLIVANDYDKIICDLMLQDITGFDIIEDCKKKYTTEEISKKFTIITAYSSDQVLVKARSYGCDVLNKPFEDMGEALKKFMEIRSE